MYVNRRMEKPLGWYPGPFVISLASIASDVGCDVDWFERIMSEQPRVDRHERLMSMAFVQSLCDKVGQLSPHNFVRGYATPGRLIVLGVFRRAYPKSSFNQSCCYYVVEREFIYVSLREPTG